jgi:hypothetical protein
MNYLSEKRLRKDSWMEKKPYPGSRLQPFISAGLLVMSLLVFLLFSSGEIVVQVLLLVVFASLTFSVAIFPQYIEFTGMAGALVKDGVAKAKVVKGLRRLIPLFSLLLVLLVAPILILVVAPPWLFLGSLMGIIAGFAGFQLGFTLYVRGWERARRLSVSRYSLVSEDERGKRLVLEYGLRAERT